MTVSSLPYTCVRTRLAVLSSSILAGAAVALLDGMYVLTVFVWTLGVTTPQRLFQGIALAVVGPDVALHGGWRTASLGVLLHCLVALGWSATFNVAYASLIGLRRIARTKSVAVLTGVAYGLGVHFAMQLVVLPLTYAHSAPLLSRSGLLVLLAHVLVVGPPIVLVARRVQR